VNPAEPEPHEVSDAARRVFGETLESAVAFVELLRAHGVERGLIGPRELDRLWDRHVLNSVVLAELVPQGGSSRRCRFGGRLPRHPPCDRPPGP
jgi:Predicted S-adenosylmethionine-dependent methyltransferase involved in bacterial cell division